MLFLQKLIPESIRIIAHNSIFQYRIATSKFRLLPHFIIIGAQKAGTTSLFYYLSQHPQIIPSIEKEVHFFDGGLNPFVDNYEKGQQWYRAHFPLPQIVGNDFVTGEASPLYMFNPIAPSRIANLIPQVKMIAILRNPTERAISGYFHEKRRGREPLPIMEALQEEDNRMKPILQNQDFKNKNFIHFSYKSRGLYKEQIERYLKYFSREQILIISSEDFFKEPEINISKVCDFLGIDNKFKCKDLNPQNVSNNRNAVSSEVYEYLNNYFLPHNQALYELIERNFDW